ncbi:MAG: mannose-6-phosphate isomerase, partial [Clostridium sp.]|nr:mannose-6-phosphate isomerase [Clostridium sp.]
KELIETSNSDKFFIFSCVEGFGKIKTKNYTLDIYKGDSVLIPAKLGQYSIEGNITLLKSYI